MSDPAPNFSAFIEATGQSIADAQSELTGSVLGERPTMAISEAELDLKAVVFQQDARLSIATISPTELRSGGIDPALLTSVRIRYVAVAESLPTQEPNRSVDEVIEEVKSDERIRRLEPILGELRYDATFVANRQSWLITVVDNEERTIRSVVLPDVGEISQ